MSSFDVLLYKRNLRIIYRHLQIHLWMHIFLYIGAIHDLCLRKRSHYYEIQSLAYIVNERDSELAAGLAKVKYEITPVGGQYSIPPLINVGSRKFVSHAGSG